MKYKCCWKYNLNSLLWFDSRPLSFHYPSKASSHLLARVAIYAFPIGILQPWSGRFLVTGLVEELEAQATSHDHPQTLTMSSIHNVKRKHLMRFFPSVELPYQRFWRCQSCIVVSMHGSIGGVNRNKSNEKKTHVLRGNCTGHFVSRKATVPHGRQERGGAQWKSDK